MQNKVTDCFQWLSQKQEASSKKLLSKFSRTETFMRIKRLILSILTIVTIAFISFSLISSVTQPQIQSRLELYQTCLLYTSPSPRD